MIGIIDYGRGNLLSVSKAVKHLGFEAEIITSPDQLNAVSKIILPGVGSFGDGMNQLNQLGFVDVLVKKIQEGCPFFGICLGMQFLFESSEESPGVPGLSVFKGKIVKFQGDMKIPHMGWNQVIPKSIASRWFEGIEDATHFYFVHSYYLFGNDPEWTGGETDYGHLFPSMICKDQIVATQFHPEKSQKGGLQLLKNWCLS